MKNQNTNLDGDLIKNYLAGDKNVLKFLIEKWHIILCNKAFWVLKDADLAKDIAQESWQVIINNLDSLKHADSFGSWATRIVYNKSIDVLNRRNIERVNLKQYSYEQEKQVVTNSDNDAMKVELIKAFNKLPSNQKEVLRLFYLKSYTLKEISRLLKISEGTVKSRLFYAREKLKETIKHRNHEN